jgi:hypothetical protein
MEFPKPSRPAPRPRTWSAGSTSGPFSHCPCRSSPLATPPTPSINPRRASRSENTRHAYRAAGVRFTAWCAIHDQTVLQASSETIATLPPLRAAATSP